VRLRDSLSRAAIYGGWLGFVSQRCSSCSLRFLEIFGPLRKAAGYTGCAVGASGGRLHHHGDSRRRSRGSSSRARDRGAAGARSRLLCIRADISPPESAPELRRCKRGFWNRFHHRTGDRGLLGTLDHAPRFAAAALSLINFCYGFFVCRILAARATTRVRVRSANPLGTSEPDEEASRVLGLLCAALPWDLGIK